MLLREDPVTQGMERVMIALLGVTSANSAPGGFYYPWDTSIYDPMLNDMLKEFKTAEAENPDAAAQFNASKVLQMGGSLIEAPGSGIFFKDITKEEFEDQSDSGVAYFGSVPGPRPQLARHIPEVVRDLDWANMSRKDWTEQACSLYLFKMDAQIMLVIFSLHTGAVKYDPRFAPLRSRLIYLSMTIQAAAEHMVWKGVTPAATRERLLKFKPL
ncbi:hypothetical protein OC846_005631 [Tilletia horrida]|uniref:Uncharacterized protein n=1 Tax=Tilletia horrida TaxID=155126 RepID=A0AAN6GQ69_9BASI|nr:hypothetical protein OC846_005631 [Tilletia horrida]